MGIYQNLKGRNIINNENLTMVILLVIVKKKCNMNNKLYTHDMVVKKN